MGSGPGAFSRHNHLSELNAPLPSGRGVLSATQRRGEVKRNLMQAGHVSGAMAAAVVEITTVGAGTYTAAQILSGHIVRDCNGASRTDTLDTATAIVGAIPGVQVGDLIQFEVVNGSDPITEIITLAAGAGGAFPAAEAVASRIVPGGSSKTINVRITNVAAPAYVVWG